MPAEPKLTKHIRRWKSCTRCPLGETATNHVFCRGTVPADVVFIGEAPGENEDLSGSPFVGRSGQVLDTIIEKAIAERRKDLSFAKTAHSRELSVRDLPPFSFAITNILCCRPPDNRNPEPKEITACSQRLQEFLTLCAPQYLVRIGKFSQNHAPTSYKTLHGPEMVEMSPEILTWQHPAYLLRKGKAYREEMENRYALQLLAAARNIVPF